MDQQAQQRQQTRKTTEENLNLLAEDIADAVRDLRRHEAERRARLQEHYELVEGVQESLKMAQERLADAIAADPATARLEAVQKGLEDMRKEAQAVYDPDLPRTFRFEDGAGLQFRTEVKSIITDEQALAQALIKQGLWDAVGAKLTVSAPKMKEQAEEAALPGVTLRLDVTVAILNPKE